MKMDLYGDSRSGFFVSSEDDGDVATRPYLKPCPFCKRDDSLTIHNTHTPSFWVACECGCEMHAPSITYTKTELRTRAGAIRVFEHALQVGVGHWNWRA